MEVHIHSAYSRAAAENYSKWSILSRFRPLNGSRTLRGFGCRVRLPGHHSGDVKNEKEVQRDEVKKEQTVASPASVIQVAEIPSGRKPQDLPIHLGMSMSLIFLLTKSSAELNRMVQVRTKMEALLAEIKTGVQKNNSPVSSKESNSTLICNQTTSSGVARSCVSHCSGAVELIHDRVIHQDDAAIDEMEAELEVELKRLQFNRNASNPTSALSHVITDVVSRPVKRRIDLSDSLTAASCIEDEGCKYEEAQEEEQQEPESPPHGGVSARELERRLHELLHKRQQERILELQLALENAEQQLHEKEREICWWKDTARLVSKHREEEFYR